MLLIDLMHAHFLSTIFFAWMDLYVSFCDLRTHPSRRRYWRAFIANEFQDSKLLAASAASQSVGCKMVADERLFFSNAVQQLARCLAAIKPTPWEKVSRTFLRKSVDWTSILRPWTPPCFRFYRG